jgi:hypothetical protein
MEFNFKCQLIITRDGGPLDPEYPCGFMEFILFIDILNNNYELKKFKFDYDIDKCGPEILPIQNEDIQKPIKSSLKSNLRSNLKPEIVVPAAVVTAGIIATPILLATLGGKTKKRNKTIKKRKK